MKWESIIWFYNIIICSFCFSSFFLPSLFLLIIVFTLQLLHHFNHGFLMCCCSLIPTFSCPLFTGIKIMQQFMNFEFNLKYFMRAVIIFFALMRLLLLFQMIFTPFQLLFILFLQEFLHFRWVDQLPFLFMFLFGFVILVRVFK